MKYATRLNSFLRADKSIEHAFSQISGISGVDYVDLNYPEHFGDHSPEEMGRLLKENGLRCNAVNLRFREQYLNGEFGNKNQKISESAIRLCEEAAAACEKLGGSQIIIWLGFDGYDYSFQMNYVETWKKVVEAFQRVCDKTRLKVSIEYKPYEERVHAFIDSFGTTMTLLQDIGRENLGVTLDFCHMLMKKENPAMAASWLLDRGKLYNIHLNDGEGSTDDGLMVGTVNFWKTLEVFYYLKKYDFQGAIYFDTFPKREEAAAECRANIQMCRKIEALIEGYGLDNMEQMIARNDAVAVSNMMVAMLR